MKEILNDYDVEPVNGGKFYLNGNNGKLLFSNDSRVFQLVNCDSFQALGLMNSLMGNNESDAEYDAKCIAALEANGWIKTIGTWK